MRGTGSRRRRCWWAARHNRVLNIRATRTGCRTASGSRCRCAGPAEYAPEPNTAAAGAPAARCGKPGAGSGEATWRGPDHHGRAELLRGGHDPAARDERLQRERGVLHPRRPGLVPFPVGDGRRPDGDLGSGCPGGGRRGQDHRLRGSAGPRGEQDGDGGLCHFGRHGHCGHRLHGHERHADFQGWRPIEDGLGRSARRLPRRGRGDVDAAVVQPLVRADDRRRGDRDDRERRSDAAVVRGAVRADGGAAGGRTGAGTDRSAA